jgi:hypothetical protein
MRGNISVSETMGHKSTGRLLFFQTMNIQARILNNFGPRIIKNPDYCTERIIMDGNYGKK